MPTTLSADDTVGVFLAAFVMFAVLLFIIYGYDALMEWWENRNAPRSSTPASSSTRLPAASSLADGQQAPAPVLNQRDWLHRVNDLPDIAPHLLIVGKSGSGKTTLARAILSQRHGQVVVITPKPDDDWGVPVVSLDADATFTTITHTLQALYRELLQRDAGGQPLTIVIDDYPIIASDKQSKDAATQLVRAVARLGRSKRMRLLLLSQESTATATGTTGEHALLLNFTRFDCHKYTHQIRLTWDDTTFICQGKGVPALASRGLAHLAIWQPPEPLEPVEPVQPDAGELPIRTSSVPVRTSSGTDDEMIRTLLDAGYSRNKIAALIGGNKQAALARIRAAAGEEVQL